jgi:hypothetical protein
MIILSGFVVSIFLSGIFIARNLILFSGGERTKAWEKFKVSRKSL